MVNDNQPDLTALEIEALQAIPSGVGVFDITGSVVAMEYLNDGFYQMIGARREDRSRFFGTGTMQSVHPEDRAGMLAEVRASIAENRNFEYRFRNLNGEGDYLWIGIRASHKSLGDGRERFYASYYDVDQYISERDRLIAYGSNLDTILGNIPGGVALFSARGEEVRLEYTNPGFYELHHGSRDYWSNQSANPVEWLIPEDRHIFLDEFHLVNAGSKEQGSVVYRITGEDGQLHFVSNQFRKAVMSGGVQYYYASFIDMDEQMAVEQELFQDKQMYANATLSAKLIIWTYDIARHQARMMQSGYTLEICRLLGIPAVLKNVPDSLLPYVAEEDRDVFSRTYRAIETGEREAECQFRFQLPGQQTQQYEHMVLKRIVDQQGRLLMVYCCGQNITDQKKSEEKFNRAYEQIHDPNSYGSFHLNLSRNWCGNGTQGKSRIPSFYELQKSGTADGYFEAFSKLIADAAVREDFLERFDRVKLLEAFAAGTEEISIEYPIVHESGVRHWRQGFLRMVRNPVNGDVEAVSYSYDIDGRKRDAFIMERLIHDHFDYIGIIHPIAGTFEFQSRKPWITYGALGEALPYDACCRYVSESFTVDSERRAFERIITLDAILRELNTRGMRSVTYLMTIGGQVHCLNLQYSWLDEAGGDILVLRADVTDAYEKEQRQIAVLAKEKVAADAANHAKTEFLSRMSHDIRTPLNGIIGMTFLTQKMELPAEARGNLEKIATSSKFLLSLVNDILDMSKMESQTMELHPEPYPFEDFCAYLDAVIRPLCEEKRQIFLLETDPVAGYTPLVDITRLNRIYFNLLSNAVKYTPEGGRIALHIHEELLEGKRIRFTLTISDNGIGMSADFQKVLFDPFTQEQRNDNSEMRGSGLGLAIVKKMVEAMNGTIAVQSKKGKGTRFTIIMVTDCVKKTVLAQKVALNAAMTNGDFDCLAGKHVLLCEDHPLNQEIARALLREKGILMHLAEDGQKGVEAFRQSTLHFYDAVLMDIRMPVMDGCEAARAIRALTRADAPTVPIIAMTADAFEESIREAKEAGMNEYVTKPVDPQNLYRTLASVMSRKAPDKKAGENKI
jgi:signal transduction histidine kinase/CheY-like chemotaxis protein/PAS domain-containing protein